jgi:acylpyruvate hydrolase
MKLLTYTYQGGEKIGALVERDRVVDLERGAAWYLKDARGDASAKRAAQILIGHDMVAFLKRGDRSLELAQRTMEYIRNRIATGNDDELLTNSAILLNLQQIRLKAPVPRTATLISAGKNFSDHVGEMSSRNIPQRPVAFLKLAETITGPEADIPYPKETQKLDYEVELAIVMGKPCVNVRKEEALEYVAGYAAFNDISARDVIRRENEYGIFLMGKNFPGFSPMGPYLVLKDEIPDPQHLTLESRVNGEVRQSSNLGYMIFDIREMIAYWSQMGLQAGDILTTGTPRGVAAGRKEGQTPWWLKPGDIVEAEVEKVGCLRNRIVAERL